MQTRRFDEREKTLEVVTGFLRVQVHVREICVRCAIHGPAFPVMTGKAVALRQGLEQLPPQMQALRACAGIQKTQRFLGAVDLPATGIGIKKEMQQTRRSQAIRQGAQPRFRLIQVMQHPHRVDVVEGPFVGQIKKTAPLLTQGGDLLGRPGALAAFPRHRQSPITDVHPEHVSTRIEMAEVIGAHPGSATGIEDPRRLHPCRDRAVHSGQNAAMTPAPVVSRWRSVLQWIPREGEAVIKRTHHGSRSITGLGVGHAALISRLRAFHVRPVDPLQHRKACKHLFMGPRRAIPAAVTWRDPACFRR